VPGFDTVSDDVVRCSVSVAGIEQGPAQEAVFHAAVRDGWVLRELKATSASLEEVFAKLTTVDAAADAKPEEASSEPAHPYRGDEGASPEPTKDEEKPS
jgi:hypothetical protein